MSEAPRPSRNRRLRRVRALLPWVLLLAVAAGWFAFLRPASMGGPAGYVIVSGASMQPLMHTGDLAVVRRRATYSQGDVVAYRIPKADVGGGMLVIHRIVGGDDASGFILKGDNRETVDIWRPRRDDIVGSLQWRLAHAGTALFLLRTPMVIAGVIAFLGFWMVVTWPDKRRSDLAEEAPVPTAPDLADDGTELQPSPVPLYVRRPGRRGLSPATVAGVLVVGLSVASAVRAARATTSS